MSDMATLQRLGQEFDRVGTFTERLRTVPFLHCDVDGDGMMVVSEPLQFIPFAPGEHGRADPLSSAPVTFDDRVQHGEHV